MMKKLLIYSLSFLLITGLLVWIAVGFFPEKLLPTLLDQQIKRIAEAPDFFADKDAITVFTVGTASPFPGERAQTGTAVFVNDHFFMFDVGAGAVQKAENIQLPLDQLDGIFISHWHSDHFIDLPYLINRSWVLGRNTDLHVYGPDGLDTLMQAIGQFLQFENQARIDHHGSETMDISKALAIPHEFKHTEGGQEIVFQQDGIKITAFDVNHEPVEPAVGYTIEYKGKKVVISGDTKKSDLVLSMAQGADLLLHEVLLVSLMQQLSEKLEANGMSRNAKIVTDIQDYHTSPGDVAQLAQEAGVKQLVLHHFAPPPDLQVIENLYRKELDAYTGPIHFAQDGDKFVVK